MLDFLLLSACRCFVGPSPANRAPRSSRRARRLRSGNQRISAAGEIRCGHHVETRAETGCGRAKFESQGVGRTHRARARQQGKYLVLTMKSCEAEEGTRGHLGPIADFAFQRGGPSLHLVRDFGQLGSGLRLFQGFVSSAARCTKKMRFSGSRTVPASFLCPQARSQLPSSALLWSGRSGSRAGPP